MSNNRPNPVCYPDDGPPVLEHTCYGRRSIAVLAGVRVVCERPLTVEPAVSCGACGLTGRVEAGRFRIVSTGRRPRR